MKIVPKIKIVLVRSNGHRTELGTTKDAPPTEEMVQATDDLITFLSTGKKVKTRK